MAKRRRRHTTLTAGQCIEWAEVQLTMELQHHARKTHRLTEEEMAQLAGSIQRQVTQQYRAFGRVVSTDQEILLPSSDSGWFEPARDDERGGRQ
jgi:hypothetical protein